MSYLRVAVSAALLAAAVPGAAGAESFVLLTHETPAAYAERGDPDRSAAYWARWTAVAGEMAAAGVLRGGSALAAGGERVGEGAGSPSLSGFFTVEAPDRAAALGWAGKLLAAGASAVDVRAAQANPAMAAAAPPTTR